MTHNLPYVVLLFHSSFRLLTVFVQHKPEKDIETWSVSICFPLVWLDRTIHEHYWISTGWTNTPDGVGSAGGRSQTAGESIRTGDLGNIGKAAGDWRHLLISRRTNQSNILWLTWTHSRLSTVCLHQQYGEWRKRCVTEGNMKVLIHLSTFNLQSVHDCKLNNIIKPYKRRPYPRIMAKDSSLEKYAAPGSTVTVSFPTVIDLIDKL